MRLAICGLVVVSVLLSACNESGLAATQPKNETDKRLELAEEYISVTQRVEHVRLIYENQLKLSMSFCRNKTCQADLDKATADAAFQVSRIYGSKIAQIYAQKLTDVELRAAIRFAKSSDGQAFTRATDSSTDDLAKLGHSMALDARQLINRNFCPSHPDICVPSGASAAQATPSVERH